MVLLKGYLHRPQVVLYDGQTQETHYIVGIKIQIIWVAKNQQVVAVVEIFLGGPYPKDSRKVISLREYEVLSETSLECCPNFLSWIRQWTNMVNLKWLTPEGYRGGLSKVMGFLDGTTIKMVFGFHSIGAVPYYGPP